MEKVSYQRRSLLCLVIILKLYNSFQQEDVKEEDSIACSRLTDRIEKCISSQKESLSCISQRFCDHIVENRKSSLSFLLAGPIHAKLNYTAEFLAKAITLENKIKYVNLANYIELKSAATEKIRIDLTEHILKYQTDRVIIIMDNLQLFKGNNTKILDVLLQPLGGERASIRTEKLDQVGCTNVIFFLLFQEDSKEENELMNEGFKNYKGKKKIWKLQDYLQKKWTYKNSDFTPDALAGRIQSGTYLYPLTEKEKENIMDNTEITKKCYGPEIETGKKFTLEWNILFSIIAVIVCLVVSVPFMMRMQSNNYFGTNNNCLDDVQNSAENLKKTKDNEKNCTIDLQMANKNGSLHEISSGNLATIKEVDSDCDKKDNIILDNNNKICNTSNNVENMLHDTKPLLLNEPEKTENDVIKPNIIENSNVSVGSNKIENLELYTENRMAGDDIPLKKPEVVVLTDNSSTNLMVNRKNDKRENSLLQISSASTLRTIRSSDHSLRRSFYNLRSRSKVTYK